MNRFDRFREIRGFDFCIRCKKVIRGVNHHFYCDRCHRIHHTGYWCEMIDEEFRRIKEAGTE